MGLKSVVMTPECNYNVVMKIKVPRKAGSLRVRPVSNGVKAKLVRIGNSRGVRIPKVLLEQSGLTERVTLRVSGNRIIVEGTADPRAGWEEAMKKAVAEHGNELTDEDREWLDAPLNSAFNEETW
jgi:antitoxin MazE